MKSIDLGTLEYYDSDANQFVYDEGGIVRFEYSLKAIYNWEAKWKKHFVNNQKLTDEEMVDFCKKMALDPVKEHFLTEDVVKILFEYIGDPQTATTFTTGDEGQNDNKMSGKILTAEEFYAMMFEAGIPLEFENRNFNRLSAILRIIASHNSPPKKMSKQDIYKQNASLNAQRKAMLKTKG